MIVLGDELYQRRTRLRLTQQELAREVGVSAGHISQIENGLASPGVQTAVRLEVALTEHEGAIPESRRTSLNIGRGLERLNDRQLYQLKVYLDHILHEPGVGA